uniref:Uncharacterized protein n=1 Tax=Sphaerodactylus townsendi TaxID=933632 RepID=A0ACB8EUI1_9SAUR
MEWILFSLSNISWAGGQRFVVPVKTQGGQSHPVNASLSGASLTSLLVPRASLLPIDVASLSALPPFMFSHQLFSCTLPKPRDKGTLGGTHCTAQPSGEFSLGRESAKRCFEDKMRDPPQRKEE